MSDYQKIVARLKAIAERLKKNSIGARAGYTRSQEGHDLDVTAMYGDLDFLSAHVETLTQQVAELKAREEAAGWAGAAVDLALAKQHTNAADFIAALGKDREAARAALKAIQKETDGAPSMILFDGQPYKAVPTALCDAIDAALAASAPQKEDEEYVAHQFRSRTPYEPGDDRDIWCADCEYHRDHRIHAPAQETERGR